MASLFISYSRKDIDAARRLTDALKGPDLDFWIDWEGIPPTVDWWKEIEKGIEETDIFLFLLSPDSVGSTVCQKEIEHAVKNGKRLIPVVVRDVPASEAPSELRSLNWIFLREQDNYRAAFSKLIKAIKTDYAWAQAHRQLQVKALEWKRSGHKNDLLLHGEELRDAEQQLVTNASKEPHPTDLQRDYVLHSRRASDRQRRIFSGVAIVIAIAMTGLALFGFDRARRATANASVAETQRAIAEANQKLADERANIALARQLAAQAQRIFSTDNAGQQTAVLLAIQSLRLFPVDDAARILQDNTLAKPVAIMVHDGLVKSVAFSPDDHYVVSGSDDHTARVWEAATGKEIARLAHSESVISIAFSPDGKSVVSGSADGTIHVWEAGTGIEIARMMQEAEVYTVGFSPDGKYVASGGCDQLDMTMACLQGSGRVWEAFTGKEIARMTHDGSVHTVLFTPDGRYVVSGSDDHTARVWEAATGKEIARMLHVGPVSSLAFRPDGSYVVSASETSDTLRVWETATGKKITEIQPNGYVYSVAFSPDGLYVMAGGCLEVDIQVACLQGSARVWEVTTGREVSLMMHDRIVHKVAFGWAGQNVVVTGSEDGIVRLWEAFTGKEVARMSHEASVSSLALSSDNRYVVSAGDHIVRVWRADMGKEIARLPYDTHVTAAVFSPDGNYLASGVCDSEDNALSCHQSSLRLREAVTGRELAQMVQDDRVMSIAFSPNGDYIASGSSKAIVRVWELATGKETAHSVHTGSISVVAFSLDGKYVVSGSDDGTIRVWEAATGKEVARMAREARFIGDDVLSVDFSPDGRYVVSASYDGSAQVWDVVTGNEITHIGHDGPVSSLDISPDGKYVVSAGEFTIQVWETFTGKVKFSKTHEALGRPAEIISVSFSPDGRYIVSGGLDNTAAVWEAYTGKEIAHVTHGIERAIVHAAFSPDGNYVVSASDGNSISIWESLTGKEIAHFSQSEQILFIRFSSDGKYVDTAVRGAALVWAYRSVELIEESCLRLTRSLTHAEWNLFIGDALPYQAVCPKLLLDPEATPTP